MGVENAGRKNVFPKIRAQLSFFFSLFFSFSSRLALTSRGLFLPASLVFASSLHPPSCGAVVVTMVVHRRGMAGGMYSLTGVLQRPGHSSSAGTGFSSLLASLGSVFGFLLPQSSRPSLHGSEI
jgi:hypothetical protein